MNNVFVRIGNYLNNNRNATPDPKEQTILEITLMNKKEFYIS
jgi:hypothetical protein